MESDWIRECYYPITITDKGKNKGLKIIILRIIVEKF
jgi:Mn-dependent DtxR family transcriptional regulator